jgi:glycosyltransferase involved in cell wall biosynthesis
VRATIVITTKNRRSDLQRALDSCLPQTAKPEILVIDDGSTDGTAEFVKSNYPAVRIVRSEKTLGLIAQRNNAARLAESDIIISIDDDSAFSKDDIVAETLEQFSDPRIVAVAIPFVNINRDRVLLRQAAPDSSEIWITNEFTGTAYAIRRDIFREAGGFRSFLFHQEEEGDLCIRLLERGYFVRLGSSAPIHHFESAHRSSERINVYGQRNLILFAWHNVPFPELLAHFSVTTFKGLFWGLRHGSFLFRVKGTFVGTGAIFREFCKRAPVSRKIYWLYRHLKKRGPLPLSNVVHAMTARPR